MRHSRSLRTPLRSLPSTNNPPPAFPPSGLLDLYDPQPNVVIGGVEYVVRAQRRWYTVYPALLRSVYTLEWAYP